MFIRMLKNDLKRSRVITATLFLFILLAAMLVSGAVSIILTLSGSMDTLLEKSSVPHLCQLHAGAIDQSELDEFTRQHDDLIKSQQTVELLGINGAAIYIGDSDSSQADSVTENSFVKQSTAFDYLLDTNNEKLAVTDGQIAVPVYYMQKYSLQIGDKIRIIDNSFEKEFTITAFLRDSIMNPSMITSKRFLISDNDWESLGQQMGEIEYMIEFQVYDVDRLQELETLYQDSALPQKGTAMTYSLAKVINALSDGIAASVIILIALMLLLIAGLCLRFTILTTIEEDYREIGVMKAVGISGKDIRKLYMVKYTALSAAACFCGYVLAMAAGNLFTANITLYMGAADKTIWNFILPIAGSALVFLGIVLFCRMVLRRFRRISALEALRTGVMSGNYRPSGKNTLSQSPVKDVNIFLGIKEVLGHFPVYGLLCFVFVLSAFLMIIPLNFLNTLQSPSFVTYMGAGKCDLRVDLQQTKDIVARYEDTEAYLQKDPDVAKYSVLFTNSFKVQNDEGEYDNMKVEVGDFSIFPLEYTDGHAPQKENELALSSMNAEEYHKKPGDTMTFLVGGRERQMTVCGIYQDVTNGGKTAKAVIPFDMAQVIWFTANIDLNPGVSLEDKQYEYSRMFQPAKVTDVSEYVNQTLGGIISQLRLVVKCAFLLAIAVSALITALFFKMLITKESGQIAIMKSLGFTTKHISRQYLTRALLVLVTGEILGVLAASLLGERLASLLISGISSMHFVVNPLSAYVLCPLSLAVTVILTIKFNKQTIKNIDVLITAR